MPGLGRYLIIFMVATVATTWALALLLGIPVSSTAHPTGQLLCACGGVAVGFLAAEVICIWPRRRRIQTKFAEADVEAEDDQEDVDLSVADATPTLPDLTWSPL